MAVKVEQVDAALIDTVCQRVRERVEAGEAPQLEEFVRQYYRWVPPDDLVGRDALDLYGAALAHWKCIVRRPRRTPPSRGRRLAVNRRSPPVRS